MTAQLVLDGIGVKYGARTVFEHVSASFRAGRVTGILGPNGAGKTTLLRVCVGLVELSGGTVRVLDRPRGAWSEEGLARTIAYLPQAAEPHWPVAAWKVVALGRLPHREPFAQFALADHKAVEEALARCDARDFANRRIDALSAGERARVLLARALATQAPILLVDEPAAHLDPAHQLRLMELLRDEAARGVAVVVTLHELSLASRFCDDIIVLAGGRVAADGPPEQALSDDTLAGAFGIRALKSGMDTPFPVIPWQRL